MANVFRSKEVYKNIRFEIDKTKKVVPVQGMYVSGEYRPPYYNEPCVHIYTFSSQHANVADFQDVSATNGEDPMVKIIDFKIERLVPSITNYTVAETDAGEGSMVKILDFQVNRLQPSIDFYQSKNQNAGEGQMVKIIDFYVNRITNQQYTFFHKQRGESTPEPTLRLSSITSERATIENYS